MFLKELWMPFLTFVGVSILSRFVFRFVAKEYRTQQKLTYRSSFMETALFFIHGFSSYVFLESKLSATDPGSLTFALAIALILIGLVAVYLSMSALGLSVTIGQGTQRLRKNGLYRLSRNPQIAAYFIVVIGYFLLWPSLLGGLWIILYLVIAHFMVETEEEHLMSLYGDEYLQYSSQTPKYIGFTKQLRSDENRDKK